MNPDTYAPEYQVMLATRARHEAIEASARAERHRRAVMRRRKAKIGGPR